MKIQPYALGRFHLYVQDFKGFESIEVRKRPRGVGEPVALTTSAWSGARLASAKRTAFDIDGLTLNMVLDRRYTAQLELQAGDTASIVSQIEAISGGYLTHDTLPAGELGFVLRTTNVGVGASILFTGDAALALGIEPVEVHGTDMHIQLASLVQSYEYIDLAADLADSYQFRLVNQTGSADIWSPEVTNKSNMVAVPSDIIMGTAQLMLPDGTAARNVLITVCYEGASTTRPNVYASTESARTDENGEATFNLVRGLPVLITIHGTNQARKILVPTVGNTFDIFDPTISDQDDNFKVRVPKFLVGTLRSI